MTTTGPADVFMRLLEPFDAARISECIAKHRSVIAGSPPEARAVVAELARPHAWTLRFVSSRLAVSRVCELRPDLRSALDTPAGRDWMRQELDEVRKLIA